MRTIQFISEEPVHVVIKSEIPPVHDLRGNLVQMKQRRLFAKFRRGEIPSWAWRIARDGFDLNRVPQDIDPERWFAFYDSVEDQLRMGWTDEERKLIEEKLVEQGYIAVERPRAVLPYRKYAEHRKLQGRRTLEFVLTDIKEAIEAAGIDPQTIIAYEQDHRDENSEAIIEAMVALSVESESEEEVVLA